MDKPEHSPPSESIPSKPTTPPDMPDMEEVEDAPRLLPEVPRFESAQLEVDALRAMLDSSSDPSLDRPSTP